MIKKTLAIICAFAMVFSFAACSKDEDLKKSNMVYNGKEVYSDKDGYYYTDADGDRVEVDKEDVEYTEYHSGSAGNSGEGSTFSDSEAEAILDMMADLDENPDKYTEDIPEPELEAGNELVPEDSFTEIEVELDSEGNPDHGEEVKSLEEIIKGGTFTIEVVMCATTDGVTTTIPFTIIKDGDKLAAETVAPMENSGSMRMKYLIKDGIQYGILPAMKFYFELGPAEEEVESVFSQEMLDKIASSNTENTTYVSTNEVAIGDKTYICDIYEAEDGTIMKTYYLDGVLARRESINPEGDTIIVEYKSMSTKVDSSALELPKNYIDVTSLMGSEMLY